MKKGQQAQKLNVVIHAIEAAGYNPYAQLTGYMATGNAAYITRQGGARTIVRDLDRTVIRKYLTDKSQACLSQ